MMRTNGCLDEVGAVIITDLQKLKAKFAEKERKLKIFNWLYFSLIVILAAYIIFFSIMPFWNQYDLLVSKLVSNANHYFLIAILVTIHLYINNLKAKSEKAEKEYEALRCEVIQRAEELWPSEEMWKRRHLFFKEMKEKYDINLYYESK